MLTITESVTCAVAPAKARLDNVTSTCGGGGQDGLNYDNAGLSARDDNPFARMTIMYDFVIQNSPYLFFPSAHKKRTRPDNGTRPQHTQRGEHKQRSAGNTPARQPADKTDGNGTASPQQQRRKPNARHSHDNATRRRDAHGHGAGDRQGRTNDARPEQNGDNGQRPAAHQDDAPNHTAKQQRGQRDNSRRNAATSATTAPAHTANTSTTKTQKKTTPRTTTSRAGHPQHRDERIGHDAARERAAFFLFRLT